MAEFKTLLEWKRDGQEFNYENYDRDHLIHFGSGTKIIASAAPEYKGNPLCVNPEEQLVAAVSSCHMLTFLAVAAKSRFTVESYTDHASGTLSKNKDGKLSVTEIILKPEIVFSGENRPDNTRLKSLHETAHKACFIANSILSKVTIN